MRRTRWLAVSPLAIVLLAGCSLTSPRPDLTKYYVLASASETAAPPISNHAPTIGLGPITMPGYLDHNEIVTRIGSNELNLSEIDRWAEPVAQNFKNVLARDLSAAIGGGQVVEFPWYNTTRLDYKVEIVVSRFDADQSGDAVLNAKWTIVSAHGGQVMLTRLSTLTEHAAGPSTGDKVAALSTDINRLSQEIGTALLQLHGLGAQARMSD